MTSLRSTSPDCRGKIRYESISAARKAIVDVKRRDPKRRDMRGLVMSAFYCPHCAGFHIGRTNSERKWP